MPRRRRRIEGRGEGRQRHVLADLWECTAELLSDVDALRRAMLEAARRAGATVIDATFHRFTGGGVTGVVAVRESHLTIHTWPERRYAAVDIFLCGQCDPRAALAHLTQRLGAARTAIREHERGRDEHAEPVLAGAQRGGILPLYALTAVVALCSIVYELLLAQTLSALLGNTVLRYSVTIGFFLGALGLGAILCGNEAAGAERRLVRIELALSALGGSAVPLFYVLDMGQRYVYDRAPSGSASETLAPLLFLAATHAVIVAIGLLSGFEVPLLLAIGEQTCPRSTNRVLGVDYFGALVGSVLFPIYLLRSFGLLTTAFAIGLLNALAALFLVAWRVPRARLRFAMMGAGIAASMMLGLAEADRIEQYFLKKFYYDDADSLSSLLAPQPERATVAHYRSAYQTIDLVRRESDEQWVWDAVIRRPAHGRPQARDLWLYLDREYQIFSGVDELYHEWLVHAPIQANGSVPARVLVLGGGDGLALREILKYGLVRRVVHVELDPQMIRLADEDPTLSQMNERSHADPRVEVVQADAFQWLQASAERFDAVFIDMPWARDYNLSLVYSREFYALVRRRLTPGGFVAIDTPGGWCRRDGSLWDIYDNTLHAAGFETVVPLVSRVSLSTPSFLRALDAIVEGQSIVMCCPDSAPVELAAVESRARLLALAQEEVDDTVEEFVVAFPEPRAVTPAWHDFRVPLNAFGPDHLPLAFDDACTHVVDPARVNSIFRPTLPPLGYLAMGLS